MAGFGFVLLSLSMHNGAPVHIPNFPGASSALKANGLEADSQGVAETGRDAAERSSDEVE